MTFRLFGVEYHAAALATTLVVALVGAQAARFLGLPLPWLLGATMAVGGAALFGLRPRGHQLQFPMNFRLYCVPVIGVMIGGAFTPQLMKAVPTWWPTLVAICLYIPCAQATSYLIYRRLGHFDRETAYFSATPGGLIEAVAMGEEAGGDPATLTLLQFSRLLVCIMVVPIAFSLAEGVAVGSAAGVSVGGPDRPPMGSIDAVILIACAVAGYLGFKRLRIPAAVITGPIFFSGIAHLSGLTGAQPPAVLIAVTQFVVGTTLGVRFSTIDRRRALKGMGLAVISVFSVLALATVFALALYSIVDETIEAVILAYAPGGVTEMSLIALSLNISVVFVSLHHVARIVFTVSLAPVGYRLLVRWTTGRQPDDP